MTNGHAGRDGMRVDNYIRCDAFTGEGHILEQANRVSIAQNIKFKKSRCMDSNMLKHCKGTEVPGKKQLCPFLNIF